MGYRNDGNWDFGDAPIDSSGKVPSAAMPVAQAKPTVALAYGPTVAIDASQGSQFEVTVTDTAAFTVQNPAKATEGQEVTLTVINTGGVMGAVTFGTMYKLAGAFVAPANGQRRSITFVYRNSAWREKARTSADQPN